MVLLLLTCFGPYAAAQNTGNNLGQVNVGASATGTATVTVTTAGVLGSISARTMGAEGLDFSNASGGSCATGTAYAVGVTCTVNVKFQPRLAGQRRGAVVLLDQSGNVLGTEYMMGTGQGPQAVILTGTGVETGIPAASAASYGEFSELAVDGAETAWIVPDESGGLVKWTLSNGTYAKQTIEGGLEGGVAVDGAGFVDAANLVYFPEQLVPIGNQGAHSGVGCASELAFSFSASIATDGAGNGYVLNEDGPGYGISFSSGTCSYFTAPFGWNSPDEPIGCCYGWSNLAIDPSGDFFLDVFDIIPGSNNSTPSAFLVKESTQQGNVVTTPILLQLSNPSSPVSDGTGNIFVANGTQSTFLAIPQSDGTYNLLSVAENHTGPLALDGTGNLFTDGGAYEFNLLNPSPVSLASTGISQSSANWLIVVANTGNTALTIGSVTYPTDFAEARGILGDCAAGQTVAVGGICYITVVFSPVAPLNGASSQTLSEEVKLVSNSLNGSATEQDIPVTGTETLPAPTIVLSSSGNPAPSGSTVTFTAKLSAVNGGPVPTGTVTFLDGSTTLGSTTLNGSTASYTAAGLSDGTHSITAHYSGDSAYAPETSAALSQILGLSTPTITWPTPSPIAYGTPLSATQLDATASVAGTLAYSPAAGTVLNVGQQTLTASFTPADTTLYRPATASVMLTVEPPAPTITLTSSKNPCLTTDTITITISVTSSSGTPTGTVTSTLDNEPPLTTTLVAGSATLTISLLTAGTHTITATYSGDSNFSPVTSSVFAQTVESFSIAVASGQSSSATVAAGGVATYDLTVTPPGVGTSLTLSVTGLPSGATATFSPATVAAGSSATTVTLSVAVPTTAAAVRPAGNPLSSPALPIAFSVLLLPFATRLRSRQWTLLLCLAAAVLALGMSACGGGGSSGNNPPPVTSKNYTLTVTAASGSLTQATQLTLTVN